MHTLHSSVTGWFILVGLVLLAMGLTAGRIRSLPLSSAICYLTVGIVIGPSVLHWYHFNPFEHAKLLEVITEVAVILSLFTAGLKMQLNFRDKLWLLPLRLAFGSMAISVGLVAAFCYFALGLDLGVAVLIGAVLAPTDPVLATDVQVTHPRDYDRLRFSLTGEAGFNDGSAFPFVMLGLGLLGLHEIGEYGERWIWHDLIWGIAGAALIGALLGGGMAKITNWLRRRNRETVFMDDFLGLGLIGLTYGVSLGAGTYAFLAVFVAGIALRRTEHSLVCGDDDLTCAVDDGIATHSMNFNEQLERISEVLLILLIGGMLSAAAWTWETLAVAGFVLFVARPVSVFIGLLGVGAPWKPLAYMGWFGVRGIGSMYYLMYIITHGLEHSAAHFILNVTLVVVTLSIFLHGISVTPMMKRYRAEDWLPKEKQDQQKPLVATPLEAGR